MNHYDCYIFAYDEPSGGVNDLVMCCDTIDEARAQVEKLTGKYFHVQLMTADGEDIPLVAD